MTIRYVCGANCRSDLAILLTNIANRIIGKLESERFPWMQQQAAIYLFFVEEAFSLRAPTVCARCPYAAVRKRIE